jgi:2-oxoglutarate dehydrogenase E2 component (dihydrolipoamide succinyltransferase)
MQNHHQVSFLNQRKTHLLVSKIGAATEKMDAEKTKNDQSKPVLQPKEESPKKSSEDPKPSSQLTPSEGSKRDTSTPQKPSTPVSKPQASGLDPNKITGTRSETRVKMSRMRLKIAERLKESQNTSAMLTTFNEIDMG